MKRVARILPFIEDYFDGWIKGFLNQFLEAKPALIDSFVEFYGEEYRYYITEVINALRFHFMFSEVTLNTCDNKDLEEIRVLQKYFCLVNKRIQYLKEKGFDKKTLRHIYIDLCTKDDEDYKVLYSEYNMMVKKGFGALSLTSYRRVEGVKKDIILPIFTLNTRGLIHEINHALTIHLLEVRGRSVIYSNPFLYEEVEEIINELCAQDIDLIFRKKGVELLRPLEIKNDYLEKLYLGESFYKRFNDVIKKTMITGDSDILLGLGNNVFTMLYLMKEEYLHPHKKRWEGKTNILIDGMERYYQDINSQRRR